MSITYTKTIDSFDELKEFCWGEALKVLDKIEEQGREDEAFTILSEIMSEGYELPTEDYVNDVVRDDLDNIMDLWD